MDNLVSEITERELRPKVPKRFEYLLPKIVACEFSFVLTGVNLSVANGIRRVMGGEVPVKRFTCEVEDITTDDVHLIPEEVIKQIECIPIMQTIPVGAKFVLEAENPTTQLVNVHTASIKPVDHRTISKGVLYNDNIILLDLHAGTSIKISIVVVEGRARINGEGMAALACLCTSIPLDIEPYFPYKIEDGRVVPDLTNGTLSSMADPRRHRIKFTTNGTIPPRELVKKACDILALMCQNILDLRSEFRLSDGTDPEYLLELRETTTTIGEIFMRSVLDTAANVRSVNYKNDKIADAIILRCRCDDIAEVVEIAMKYAKERFLAIGREFD